MKNRLVVALGLSLVLSVGNFFSLHAAAVDILPATTADTNTEYAELAKNFANPAMAATVKNMLADGLSASRYENFNLADQLEGLNYVTAKEIGIDVPGMPYRLVAHWGFGGAGESSVELMLPLPEVPFRLVAKDGEEEPAFVPRRRGVSLTQLGKILFKGEVSRFVGAVDGNVSEVLTSFGFKHYSITPSYLFIIKLALLIEIGRVHV